MRLVSRYTAENGQSRWSYGYGNPSIDLHGRGFVGFGRRTIEFNGPVTTSRGSVTTILSDLTYDPVLRDYPYAGRPESIETVHLLPGDSGNEMRHVTCEEVVIWDIRPVSRPGGTTWTSYPRIQRRHDHRTMETDTDPCSDLSLLTRYNEQMTVISRDDFGTVTSTQTEHMGGERITVTPLNIINDETNWFIGQARRIETRSCLGDRCRQRTVEIEYDPTTQEVVSTVVQPGSSRLELTTDLSYHPVHGQIETVTQTNFEGDKRTTATEWDAEGAFPVTRTNDLGHRTAFVYDSASGSLRAHVDPNGITIRYSYDGFFRPVGQQRLSSPLGASDNAGVSWQFLGGANGPEGSAMRLRTIIEGGQDTVIDYGPTGLEMRRSWKSMRTPQSGLFTAEAGEDVCVSTEYDDIGRRHRVSNPHFCGDEPEFWTNLEYDSVDRLLTRVRPGNDGGHAQEGWTYTESRWSLPYGSTNGVRVDYEDPQGHASFAISDGQGRIAFSGDAAETITCYGYGPFGFLESVQRNCAGSTGHRPETTYTYDVLGRQLTETDPSFETRTTTYTAFGEPETYVDGNGQSLTFEYDGLGRMIASTSSDGETMYTWDTQLVGAKRGLLRESKSEDGVARTYSYDEFGRIKTDEMSALNTQMRAHYVYGQGSMLESLTYKFPLSGIPDLGVVYVYDEVGHLRQVRDGDTNDMLWSAIEANPAGMIEREIFGNRWRTERSFDEGTLLVERITTRDPGDEEMMDLTLGWTPAENLDFRTEAVSGQTENFLYDPLNRLIEASIGQTEQTFGYDALGNLLRKSELTDYVYDTFTDGQLDLVTGPGVFIDIDHDDNGNVTRRGVLTLTWTPWNEIRSIVNGSRALKFHYDASGRRAGRFGESSTVLYFGPLEHRQEVDPDNAATEVSLLVPGPAGRPVARLSLRSEEVDTWEMERTYIHPDQLGSGTLFSTEDGALAQSVSHGPWGSLRTPADWTDFSVDTSVADMHAPGFTGHAARRDFGLIDFGGRIYDPELGRFLSPDPFVPDMADGQAWNRYSYVRNRPTVLIDPSGLLDSGSRTAGSAGVGGGGSSVGGLENTCTPENPDDICRLVVVNSDGANGLGNAGIVHYHGPVGGLGGSPYLQPDREAGMMPFVKGGGRFLMHVVLAMLSGGSGSGEECAGPACAWAETIIAASPNTERNRKMEQQVKREVTEGMQDNPGIYSAQLTVALLPGGRALDLAEIGLTLGEVSAFGDEQEMKMASEGALIELALGVLLRKAGPASKSTAKTRELFGRQTKHEFSSSKIRRLKKNMKQNGFDPNKPIEIVEVDGRKIIVDGHHRARAAGAAGIKEVPVKVLKVDPATAERYVQEAAEAAHSLGLTGRW
jgi:RHS repeat-associated protein